MSETDELELSFAVDAPPEAVEAWWIDLPAVYEADDPREQPHRIELLEETDEGGVYQTTWRGLFGLTFTQEEILHREGPGSRTATRPDPSRRGDRGGLSVGSSRSPIPTSLAPTSGRRDTSWPFFNRDVASSSVAEPAVESKQLTREGERVRLRPVQDGDLDDLVAAADDDEIARWTDLPHPYAREHGAQFIALAEEEARVGKSFHLAIATIDQDRLVGMAALSDVDLESRNAEIGIWIGREAWGEGIAFEAFDLLLEIAFDRLDLTKLYGVVLEGNEASIDLFKRYGFHEEGRLRWHTRREGDWMDKVFFGLLREEWERRTGRA